MLGNINEEPNTSKYRTKVQKFKNICKKITTFLFSRIGLCFLVVGYVLMGGFIFQSIEGSHEMQERAKNSTLLNDIETNTKSMVNEIWNMTKLELIFHEKNYTNKLKDRLIDYQKKLSNAVKQGYKGNLNPNSTKWTYTGAVVYSITVVTSIGNFFKHLLIRTLGIKSLDFSCFIFIFCCVTFMLYFHGKFV